MLTSLWWRAHGGGSRAVCPMGWCRWRVRVINVYEHTLRFNFSDTFRGVRSTTDCDSGERSALCVPFVVMRAPNLPPSYTSPDARRRALLQLLFAVFIPPCFPKPHKVTARTELCSCVPLRTLGAVGLLFFSRSQPDS